MSADTDRQDLLKLATSYPEVLSLVEEALEKVTLQPRVVTANIKRIRRKGKPEAHIAKRLAEVARGASEENEKNLYFLVEFAQTCKVLDQPAEALSVYEQFEEKYGTPNKSEVVYYVTKASLLRNLRQYSKARQIIEELPPRENVINERAEIYYLQQDYMALEELVNQYRKRLRAAQALNVARYLLNDYGAERALRFISPYQNRGNAMIDNFAAELEARTPASPEDGKVVGGEVIARGIARFEADHDLEKTVFLMMKFAGGNQEKDEILENLYKSVKIWLDKYGFDAVRADEKDYSETGYLWDNVQIYASACKYGVAVLENLYEEEMNPNVAMEYGYMLGKSKRVLLLKEASFKRIRVDLLGKIWKEFNINDEHTIAGAIMAWMVDLGGTRIKA